MFYVAWLIRGVIIAETALAAFLGLTGQTKHLSISVWTVLAIGIAVTWLPGFIIELTRAHYEGVSTRGLLLDAAGQGFGPVIILAPMLFVLWAPVQYMLTGNIMDALGLGIVMGFIWRIVPTPIM